MKNTLLIVILFLSTSKCFAQADETMAHFRSYSFLINTSFDTRLAAATFKPTIDINTLNGKLHFGAHYALQMYKLETADKGDYVRSRTYIHDNMNNNFSSFEVDLGFNFFNRLQEDVLLSANRTSGNWTFYGKEPGSRAFNIGVHGGFGGYKNNSGFEKYFFDLKNAQGTVIPSYGPTLTSNYYSTIAYVKTNYLFLGSNNYICKKFEDDNDDVKGGKVINLYVDAIMPLSVNISNVTNINGEVFTPVPKNGDNWKKIGARAGVAIKGTGKYGLNLKFEQGFMPSFTTYGNGSFSNYTSLDFGIHITPLIGLFELKSTD